MRGYFGVGLISSKDQGNMGNVIRTSFAFGAAYLNFINSKRVYTGKADTAKGYRHMPVSYIDKIEHFVPIDSTIVCCEISDNARAIADFQHPERAYYLFGPENGSIDDEILKNNITIKIPSRICLNLSVSVGIVIHDRINKQILDGSQAKNVHKAISNKR